MQSYTVREWDKLTYGDGGGQIPKNSRISLQPLHSAPRSQARRWRRTGAWSARAAGARCGQDSCLQRL
jgi:hypothetical protein